jgi:hypothetical protein
MNIAQALATYPDAQIAISRQSLVQRLMIFFMERGRRSRRGVLPPGFKKTMGEEDKRRPRMDLGLGVWSVRTNRYYPLECLRAHDGALIDDFEGQRLLIYIDPISSTPTALYTNANACSWQGDDLHLDTGETVSEGKFSDGQGGAWTVTRPMQLFTRWYGFAYTFPGCEIYED